MSKHVPLFATRNDILSVTQAIEQTTPLKYTQVGLFDSPTLISFDLSAKIEDLGIASIGDQNHEKQYLVTHADTHIKLRKVPQRRGGVRYAIDQMENPQGIILGAGGTYQQCCLIAGRLGTASDDAVSRELLRHFSKELRRHFEMIRSFYVGPEASRLLDQGWRLTISARSPESYDLKH